MKASREETGAVSQMSNMVNHWEARTEAVVRGDIPPRCPIRSGSGHVVSPRNGDRRTSNGSGDGKGDSAHLREVFWMKLLEEQALADDSDSFIHTVDDEERSEQDFLSRRNSLVGKEIAPDDYMDGSSPVSISSTLNDRESDNLNDEMLKDKPEPIQTTAKGTKAPQRQQKAALGSKNADKRSFGDVTNSSRFTDSKAAEESKVSNAIKIFQGETNPRERSDKSWINSESDVKDDTQSLMSYKNVSTPAKATMMKYLTPSPQPSAVAKSTKLLSTKLEMVGPNPEDQNKFRWAHDIWCQAGLMKSKPRYSTTDSSFWQQRNSARIRKSLAQLSPEFSIDEKQIGLELSSPESTSPSTCSSEDNVSPLSATKTAFKTSTDANAESKAGSVDATDQGGFQHILDMWRDHSDTKKSQNKPLAHFECAASTTSGFKATIDCVASSGSKSFPPKHPETKRSPMQPSPRKFGELSAISVASSELVPYNFEASTNCSSQVVPSDKSFVDTDVYTYDCDQYYGGDSSKALVILQNQDRTYDVVVGETRYGAAGEHLVIRNLENFTGSDKGEVNYIESDQRCECSASIFSGNDDLISFFLPQMGMACSCGHQKQGLINPDDPTGIENVLRPWQCEFLRSFGIYRGEQLVHAKHRSADILAKALRQWRKKHDMTPFKTSACMMALNIWAKTCKAYVRSIRKQILDGNSLLERQSGTLMKELSLFLNGLPEAPTKQDLQELCQIEPESQVEV